MCVCKHIPIYTTPHVTMMDFEFPPDGRSQGEPGRVVELPEACRCGGVTGEIRPTNGQNCLYCVLCGKFVKNVPKTQTGEKRRSVSTTHAAIRPKQRARVLERASNRCEFCGAAPPAVVLNADHLLTVDDGHRMGLTDEEINHDENLAATCEECNLGRGRVSVSPRIYVALLRRRARQ